ncbi:MAG: hypothetical protein F4X92_02515 [Gammaproteobacteria bacterium]|nr:hypothetical protein [Gammaproteobacteria bacterium]
MPDIFLYNAEIARKLDYEFINHISKEKQNDDCLLILVTGGGDADAAYKIGRYIQDTYDSFSILVSGICKSAGTLLAISAKELIFAPYGELGPIDVQMQKEDQLGSLHSGLNINEGFRSIETRATDTYHRIIGEVLTASEGNINIRTALHAASELVSSLYSPILGRIDPEEVGSRSRDMRIGRDYAMRLNEKWGNLRQTEEAIQWLTTAYPSHGFVIDYREAKTLFNNVRLTTDHEMGIIQDLDLISRFPSTSPIIKCLNHNENEDNETEESQ